MLDKAAARAAGPVALADKVAAGKAAAAKVVPVEMPDPAVVPVDRAEMVGPVQSQVDPVEMVGRAEIKAVRVDPAAGLKVVKVAPADKVDFANRLSRARSCPSVCRTR